jgi:hypothetical protein
MNSNVKNFYERTGYLSNGFFNRHFSDCLSFYTSSLINKIRIAYNSRACVKKSELSQILICPKEGKALNSSLNS